MSLIPEMPLRPLKELSIFSTSSADMPVCLKR